MSERSARSSWLRRTLRLSQQEAVASATMTATGDNFFNAFAIHLQASATQMGALTRDLEEKFSRMGNNEEMAQRIQERVTSALRRAAT